MILSGNVTSNGVGAEVTTTISHSGNAYMYAFTSSGDCVIVGADTMTSAPMFVTLSPFGMNAIIGTNCTPLLRVDQVSYNDNKWILTIWRIDDMLKTCNVGFGV